MTEKKKEKHNEFRSVDWNLLLIIGLIAVVTSLHYLTSTHLHHYHELYRRLYYVPLLLAAFRYNLTGGVLTAIGISLVYLPHVIFQWKGSFLDNLVRFNEIVLYVFIGSIAGFLSQKLQKEKNRYKITADELSVSYKKLQEQTNQLSEMESQLRAADRLAVLGELAASLAHEVRNPLASIKGSADILKKRSTQDETAKEFSALLSKEVDRLNQVVENYLDIARKPIKKKEQSNLRIIIESVLNLTGPQIHKKNCSVHLNLTKKPLMTAIPEVEVRQVFLNLLLNSLDALDQGGQIQITATVDQNKIIVEVTDTGRGIPQDQINKIFQPFYTTRTKGTGLGLSIVKRIMESYKGSITIVSQEQVGTTIKLEFINVQ